MRALLTGEAAGEAIGGWLRTGRDPTPAYEAWLDTQLREYLREREAYYALEKRWPHEPFWQRRQGLSGSACRPSVRHSRSVAVSNPLARRQAATGACSSSV